MPINPTLASTLLEIELENERQTVSAGGVRWHTGVKTLDKDLPWNLWRSGNIYGIGEVEDSSVKNTSSFSLELEIISTHILESAQRQTQSQSDSSASPLVYIISPPPLVNTTIQSLYKILVQRLKRQPTPNPSHTTAEAQAEDLLSAISILPTLDLAGLAAALSEVSSSLDTARSGSAILLIHGLAPLLADAHRRSGTVQSAALLSGILNSVRSLSRAKPLTLVGLDVAPSSTQSHATGLGLGSAFASSAGGSKPYCLAMTAGGGVLGRLVLDALDVVVLVHDGGGKTGGQGQRGGRKRIVEVVSDAVGFTYGNWAVWESEQ